MKVDEFLARGGSVCPYARGSDQLYVMVGRVPSDKRRKTLEVARNFTPGRAQALLVVGPALPDFDATRTWAREVFLELMLCLGVLDGASEKEVAEHIRTELRPLLSNEKDPRRPMLGFRGKPLYTICMSPVYPKTHPRYAPEPTVVVTWGEDVARVHGQPATDQIREAMQREHGFVYDADDLMLPLPPAPSV